MRRNITAIQMAITLAAALLLGCAHAERSGTTAEIEGRWEVKWCDKRAPASECGGFAVELNRNGDLVTGESFGARPRLAQIDEGGRVHGLLVGTTAVLTVESLRSGAIYLVRVSVGGNCLHWKVEDTIRPAEQDIDIIAFDEVLTRVSAAKGGEISGNQARACK